MDARGFDIKGPRSVARLLVRAHRCGWRRIVVYACRGDRIHTRDDLLMVDGVLRCPEEVFRKVVPSTAPEPVE